MIEAGADEVVIPVAGECDDTWLDDIRRRWVTVERVREAIAIAAEGPMSEGVVGAGTGMVTMGHKGGIGTASRVLDGLGTIGVLLLCNFGGMRLLRLGGMPVGETLAAERVGCAHARHRRQLHRRRRHRHPPRRPPAHACRPPGRARPGPSRFGRPQRQR